MPAVLLAVYRHDPHARLSKKKKEIYFASSCLLVGASEDKKVGRIEDELTF